VIVDEELPYPATSGKRIRTLNLTLRLARRHRVTYLCHRNADPREAEEAREHFALHGVDTVVVDRAVPSKKGLGFYARLGLNLLSPLPYSVATHTSKPLRQAALSLAASETIDLWHCEWTPYAEVLRCLPGAKKLVMAHNVESLIWQRYFETESSPLKRWYIGRQWRKFQRFERRVLGEATRTVAVSPEDAALFRDSFGAERVSVVDNGVDVGYFSPADVPRPAGQLLFLGSLDWRPNLDAVDQFLSRVLPAVRRERPEVEGVLVGRNPPPALRRRVEGTPGVRLHADVADVRPYIAGSTLLVVPLRIGGGSRLKILEALSMGLPVVSTRVGAEGLCLRDGEHLSACASVDDLAGEILRRLGDPQGTRARADAGQRLVRERYNWESLADRLEEVWYDAAAARA
jgi:glycosyltransferase involved in cell wall biosynthesis